MSDLIAIGSSAVLAYRNALSAVGENVANSETVGYVRRTVVLSEGPVTGHRASARFNGVSGEQVARSWDGFLAREVRDATGLASASATEQAWLTEVETALDDGPNGVGQSTAAVFTAATRLAADPASVTGRAQFLDALDSMATSFGATEARLDGLAGGIANATEARAAAVTATLSSLDLVNRQLRVASAGSSEQAGLEDQRDAMLDTLAADMPFTATIADDGSVTVTSNGAPTLPLLDAKGPARLVALRDADGLPILQLTSLAGTSDYRPDGGALAGLASAAAAIADKRVALNTLAADSVGFFNGWSAGGLDTNGAAGAPLLSGGSAADIAAIPRLPADVATATATAANGNLLELAAQRPTSALEQRWSAMVTDNAQALATVVARAQSHAALRDGAMLSLDRLTGVDLDREAADLVRLQQAYGGAARVLQVAREMLDTLFNATS